MLIHLLPKSIFELNILYNCVKFHYILQTCLFTRFYIFYIPELNLLSIWIVLYKKNKKDPHIQMKIYQNLKLFIEFFIVSEFTPI